MPHFDEPAYVLDLGHSLNCATIEGAKPGAEIKVLVRAEGDSLARTISAKGLLSADGQDFQVTVTTSAGEQTHTWDFQFLKAKIDAQRKRR